MKKLTAALICITAGLLQTANGQNLSNKGKEFWVAYGHHYYFESGDNIQNMVLYLSAEQAATVTVSINGTSWTRTYTIAANTVIFTDFMPKGTTTGSDDSRLFSKLSTPGSTNSEGIFNKGIHIVSNVPIVAYAHIFGSSSSGATMLMPVETWGYSYVSVNCKQAYTAPNCFSWMYVIARENNTKVRITPSVPTRSGLPANVPFDVVLQKGEVYQLLGAGTGISGGFYTGQDVTGTTVTSIANDQGKCYPIAAFSGSSRTLLTTYCTGSTSSGDNMIQQIFPQQAWGKRYLTSPTSSSTAANTLTLNFYRIVVKDPATVVRRNGIVLTGLVANRYYDYSSATADYITADKPILVAQYIPSQGCTANSGNGDPEMFFISPVEQSIKRVGFYRNTREAITVNYLTLIVPTGGVSSLKIDNNPAFDYSFPHPNLPGYTVVVKRWVATQSQCIVTSDSAFTAIAYGLGSVESYGYNAGTLINNLSVIGEVRNAFSTQVAADSFTCRNTPFYPTILISYKPTKMVWEFSQASNISPAADVPVSSPVLLDSQLISGVQYYRYRLNQTYSYSDTGTYTIPVLLTSPLLENCDNSEEVRIQVIVKGSLKPDFSFTNTTTGTAFTGCRSDTVYFSGNVSAAGLAANRYKWSFSTAPADTSILMNPKKLYGTAGVYNVKFSAFNAEGCTGDTTKTVTIYPPPAAGFISPPTSICEPTNVLVTSTTAFAGGNPLTSWYWDFGNGQTALNTTNSPVSVAYPKAGTYTIRHVAKLSALCISDTAVKIITIYTKPTVGFTYPQSCLGTDGSVQFVNTSSVADGQTLTYTWNFGDQANSTAANPNTSAVQNPTHKYALSGNYSVQLTVTTVNGCSKDTVISVKFTPRPALVYALLPGVCINHLPLSVASATITNGITGSGIYRGDATDTAGNFNPAAAGAGVHTVWYIFRSSGGCQDSVSQTIRVFAKPVADFSISRPAFCADSSTILTDLSAIASGTIANRNWSFGNGSTAVYQNSNPVSRSYPAGSYLVKLFVVSDSACISDTASKTITVNPLPVAGFAMPSSICMPAGKAQFTNASAIAGNGALTYAWNFGDTKTSTDKDPLHVYLSKGSYTVMLRVTSAAGCKSDTAKILSGFYDQPLAQFSLSPSVLCQGVANTFTNQSTAPGSNISKWNWNFGDATVSSLQNPVKQYVLPGTFTVALNVQSAQGCLSDTFRQTVTVNLQPQINAGPSFVVPDGSLIRFSASTNDSTLKFLWTPGIGLSSDTILKPSLIAHSDQAYFITATGPGNCTASDSLTVRVLRPISIPNAFSPNGDGINDTWMIPNLSNYAGATVEIYDRYGRMIIRRAVNSSAWDGRYQQKDLPMATYYYIIDLKNGTKPLTGSVSIIR